MKLYTAACLAPCLWTHDSRSEHVVVEGIDSSPMFWSTLNAVCASFTCSGTNNQHVGKKKKKKTPPTKVCNVLSRRCWHGSMRVRGCCRSTRIRCVPGI